MHLKKLAERSLGTDCWNGDRSTA